MNIEQLQYVCMVAKTNSITIAAENLYVTQQTISKAINKLENELGVVLMLRSHKGIQLTDAGQIFVEQATDIVRRFQDLYEAMYVSTYSSISGQITIYQSSYLTNYVGAKFLGSMHRLYPKLRVNIEDALTMDMIEKIKHSSNEIALVQMLNGNCGHGKIEDFMQWIDVEEIGKDTLVACVAENGPLAKKDTITLKELVKYPIAWGECSGLAKVFEQDYNVGVKVIVDSSNFSLQRAAILEGMAVSFATEMLIHNDNYDRSGFKILQIKENLRLTTALIKPKGYELNQLQRIAIEELKRSLTKI